MQELLFIRGYCSRARATVHAAAPGTWHEELLSLFGRGRAHYSRARAWRWQIQDFDGNLSIYPFIYLVYLIRTGFYPIDLDRLLVSLLLGLVLL